MAEALRNKDFALAGRIAHKLRGVSGNIGATEVQTAAEELEIAIGKGHSEERLEEILQRLANILEATIARIKDTLPEPGEKRQRPALEPASPEELAGFLRKLASLAEESDTGAARYLETVRDHIATQVPGEALEKLEASLRAYDFTAALQILRHLQGGNKG